MALPSFRSKGARGTGTTSCTAAVPTGGDAPQTNDILLIVVESTDSNTAAGTPNTPSGWTKLFERTEGDGAAGVTTLTVFGKRAGASESDVTVDGVGNHCTATMLVYKDAVTTGDAWVVGSGNGAASGDGTMLGLTTPEDDCLVIAICGTTRDSLNTNTFSSWTNSNLSSLTEREDETINTASGGGFGVADGGKASAGATGDTTVTIGVSAQWNSVHIALKPISTTTPKSGSETLGVEANEGTPAIAASSTRTDTEDVSISEGTPAIAGSSSQSETLGVAVSEGTPAIAASSSRSDTEDVSIDEASAVQAGVTASESEDVSIADAAAVAVLVSPTDTEDVSISEGAPQLAVSLARSDDLNLSLDEAASILVSLARSDGLDVEANEGAVQVTAIFTRTDDADVAIADGSAIAVPIAVAETLGVEANEAAAQVISNPGGDDELSVSIGEAVSILVLVTVTETLGVETAEGTPDISVSLARSDGLDLSLAEGRDLQVNLSSADITDVGVSEGAVQLVVSLARSDAVDVALDDAPSITAFLSGADQLAITIADSASALVAVNVSELVDLQLAEVAAIEEEGAAAGLRIKRTKRGTLADWNDELKGIAPRSKRWRKLGK